MDDQQPPDPNASLKAYRELLLRDIAAKLDLTYEQMVKDLRDDGISLTRNYILALREEDARREKRTLP